MCQWAFKVTYEKQIIARARSDSLRFGIGINHKNTPSLLIPCMYSCDLLSASVHSTSEIHKAHSQSLIFFFPSSCNFVFHKFNTTLFFTLISLTFLCIVPSTWKNKDGVQEKLGIELTFRVDKSLLLSQALFKKKKLTFFSIFFSFYSVGKMLLCKLN